MAPYSYTELSGESHKIRLLTLLPGEETNPISCHVTAVELSDSNTPEYEALSYVWGPTADTVALEISPAGSTIQITRNLAQLLPHLRQQDQPRILWIDAICINQQDLDERSRQVRYMAEVYRRAGRVVAWLGTSSEQTTVGISLLQNLADKLDVDWNGNGTMRSRSPDPAEAHWGDQHQPLPFGVTEWEAIAAVLRAVWFSRLWILQDIRLANRRAETPVVDFNVLLDRAYDVLDYGEYASLKTLIFQARHGACHDPRDRVYAIQGMLYAADAEVAVQPDYKKTASEVYKELVLRFLHTKQQLSMLLLCELRDLSSALPSWVPDLAVANSYRPLLNFRASGDSPCCFEYREPDTLRVAGTRVGTVELINPLAVSADTSSKYESVFHAARSFAQRHQISSTYSPGKTYLEAYIRTMCAGRMSDKTMPPNETLPGMQAARIALEAILQTSGSVLPELFPSGAKKFLDYANDTCQGRCFFETAEGHVGVGPRSMRASDQICVLLGCDSPVLLRLRQDGTSMLVGECYVPDLMCNEAILGALPSGMRRVSRLDAASNRFTGAYVDEASGEVSIEDPRLGTLPRGWTRKGHASDHLVTLFAFEGTDSVRHAAAQRDDVDPRLERSALRERGILLEDFELR